MRTVYPILVLVLGDRVACLKCATDQALARRHLYATQVNLWIVRCDQFQYVLVFPPKEYPAALATERDAAQWTALS